MKKKIEILTYIHNNPTKGGICRTDVAYKFSSSKFYNELGDEFDFLIRFDS